MRKNLVGILLILLLVALMLGGCARRWYHPENGWQGGVEYSADSLECRQKAPRYTGPFSPAGAIYNDCMRAKGWTVTRRSPPSEGR